MQMFSHGRVFIIILHALKELCRLYAYFWDTRVRFCYEDTTNKLNEIPNGLLKMAVHRFWVQLIS